MIKQFANVSCAKLLQLIGLQPSTRREYIDSNSVYTASNPFFLSAPVRLYVLLHFYADTRNGIINHVPIDELAAQLQIHKKTLISAIVRLSDAGFISAFSGTFYDDYYFTTCLTDYKDMFLPMGKGGRGYIAMNQELLKRILATKHINSLRIMIRMLVETADAERFHASNQAAANVSLRQLRTGLPKYIKPCIIKTTLSSLNDVFVTIFGHKKRFSIRLNERFHGKLSKEAILAFSKDRINQEIDAINQLVKSAYASMIIDSDNTGYLSPEMQDNFMMMGIHFPVKRYPLSNLHKHTIPLLNLSQNDISDCVSIAKDYGLESTISALRTYYSEYVLGELNKKMSKLNIGGLIRRIVMENHSFSSFPLIQ